MATSNNGKGAVSGAPSDPPKATMETLVALFEAADYDTIGAQLPTLLEAYPDSILLLNVAGATAKTLGDLPKAAQIFLHVTKLNPAFPDAHRNLGIVLREQGEQAKAITCFAHAARLAPQDFRAQIDLAATLRDTRQISAALGAFGRALAVRPDDAATLNQAGLMLAELGRLPEALECYSKALDAAPDNIYYYGNAATALEASGQTAAALQLYDKIKQLAPRYAPAAARALSLRQSLCSWATWAEDVTACEWLGLEGDPASPLAFIAAEDSPERQLQRSVRYTAHQGQGAFQPFRAGTRAERPAKLRVGLFSTDFRGHAVVHLIAGLLRTYDKSRFELIAYSYSGDVSGPVTAEIAQSVDGFVDLGVLSDAAAVARAKEDALDIAIDLNGHTGESRLGLFASRLAPVQMTFLGYPASSGARYVDYMIADGVTIPPEQRAHYSESLIRMPHCYMPADDQRVISDRVTTRADHGLPEDGFVFCGFNNTRKITPAEFDVWMRLLDQVDGSVLWLSRRNADVEANLRAEAEARGMDPDRLVFAQMEPKNSDHLARQHHADLFLDTFNYNAHTTASDALWAGLPIVTREGEQFAARVCASLVSAVGLAELVTHDTESYEALALTLARDPARLAEIRQRLNTGLKDTPLFDTERYSRDFERGLDAAYALYLEGKQPEDIQLD